MAVKEHKFRGAKLKALLELARRFAAKGREDPKVAQRKQERYASKVWAGEYVDFSLVKSIVSTLGMTDYAIVGGQAAILYGSPRVTVDVDILSTRANIEKVIEHFVPRPSPMTIGGYTVQLHGIDVDLLHWHDAEWLRALLQASVDHKGIRVVSKPWLMFLKLQASRYIDLVDALPVMNSMTTVERRKARRIVSKHAPNELEDFDSILALSELIGPEDFSPEKDL